MDKVGTVISPHKAVGVKNTIAFAILQIVKGFETIGSRWPLFGTIYCHLFYRGMIREEGKMAGLQRGMKVLHIGSGPLPLTALCLAREGYQVDGVDNDPGIVERSTRLVKRFGLDDRITIHALDGLDVDCSGFDAVWLSLHVFPKGEVLRRVLSTLPEGGRVIYRNPRGWLSFLYPDGDARKIEQQYPHEKSNYLLGKEIVVVCKEG